ncbi:MULTISPECIES: DUF2480 family protein [unclassified Flavobacterium]|uniref:DUF2480 family protein n=1 Tax=unclassified Flavobacterium TaxID=196869 RepID=UPI0012A78F2E|nr:MULTISPECIES: DUF2480 family protein [unclassified Flavobacterium]MBF4484324.1 DUF2480 family protein [Flavobacterium sp. CSZ]QGK72754.1 DUF2480 family protein [Flavobacterium sp. SLB02]
MEIINKIDASGIQTLDLRSYKPSENDFIVFDIVPFLIEDFLLQEKAFRSEMANINWTQFTGKDVVITCSNDAIVPLWAYVLISSLLAPHGSIVLYSVTENHINLLWIERVRKIEFSAFINQKVVLKANSSLPEEILVLATSQLIKYVKTLMWGEAGSPLMIYKRK